MNKKINKLVVPLTIKSMSLLGTVTIMATSIGGCTTKNKKNNSSDTASIISSTSEDENTSDLDVISSNESTINKDNINENSTSSKITNNSKNTTTANNQSNINSKPNSTKPSTNNNSSQRIPNTNNNQNSNIIDFIPLTKDNINDTKIFKRAVREVAKNTRGGFGGIWTYYYNEQEYTSYGLPDDEFIYILVSLNQDYLTDETLNTLLGSYSEDDLKRFIQILGVVPLFIEDARKVNNWDGLILDSNIKKQFNDIEKVFLEYLNNNPKPLQELLENYDYNNNPLVGYYLANSCNAVNEYSNLKDSEFIDKFSKFYWDMEEACEQEATNMYNKIHGKTKVLE